MLDPSLLMRKKMRVPPPPPGDHAKIKNTCYRGHCMVDFHLCQTTLIVFLTEVLEKRPIKIVVDD